MSFEKFSLVDALEDLSSRFIINVTESELSKTERICFHIEQAHWFYEDFVREQNPALPHLELDRFMQQLFEHCKTLGVALSCGSPQAAYAKFKRYKRTVPVCGAVIFNESLDKVLLVRAWSSNSWSFPMGKINENEAQLACAVREVEEETGFNVQPYIIEDEFLQKSLSGKEIRLYYAVAVPESTEFRTLTRKEISAIRWFNVGDLLVDQRQDLKNNSNISNENDVSVTKVGGKAKFYLVNSFAEDIIYWVRRKTLPAVPMTSTLLPPKPSDLMSRLISAEFNIDSSMANKNEEEKTNGNSHSTLLNILLSNSPVQAKTFSTTALPPLLPPKQLSVATTIDETDISVLPDPKRDSLLALLGMSIH